MNIQQFNQEIIKGLEADNAKTIQEIIIATRRETQVHPNVYASYLLQVQSLYPSWDAFLQATDIPSQQAKEILAEGLTAVDAYLKA